VIKKILYLILLVGFILHQAAFSQAVLTASLNKNSVAVGEQFQLTYTINGNGRNFQGPDLRDFNLLGGPNQSSQIQIINGSYSQSLSFTYYLQAKAEGNYKIGFASIEADGKRIQSNGLIINVVKGNPAQSQNSNSGNQDNSGGLSDKNIFLRAEVNKTSVYRGEALTVTFKLYTNVNIVNYSIAKAPSLNGFWNQDVELPEQLQLQNATVDGINYKVGVLKKVILFPQQSGTLSIDPMELECIARVQVKGRRTDPFGAFQNDPFFNDPFFGFGGARDVKYAFKSNKVAIAVKELPAGAPATFNGSVGELSFDAKLDKNTTKANEPVSLKIKISGTGNLKLIEAPQIDFPGDIEAYDPKINDNIHVSESGVSGSKTIEYLLIPRHEGTYDLQPVTFSYFDLSKKQYISKTEGPFTLKVGRGSGNTIAVSPGINKSDFQLLGKDIRYIKITEPEFIHSTGRFFGSAGYYALIAAPFVLLGGVAWYKQKLMAMNSDVAGVKSRKATAMAVRRLSSAKKLMTSGQQSSFYEEVSKAMWGFMGDKLSIPPSELSKDKVYKELTSRNVNPEFVNTFISTLDECEMARFAGSVNGNTDNIYNKAVSSITNIEQSLKA
jgi:hypothetical protein